jgi:protein ImuB
MSLWLCLRFEWLPLQALTRQQGGNDEPVAILDKQRVLQASDAACELGVKAGMSPATVRALGDDIRMLERSPEREQHCLQQLCCWAYSVSPRLYPWREDCLLLEIGGCLALFRGLDRLLDQVHADLSSRGYAYHSDLAPTPKAAWLLSHAEHSQQELPLADQLAPLPLQLLTDYPKQIASLARAGLWTLGDILSLPDAALSRRCGRDMSLFLQQVLGTREDLSADFQPPAKFSDHYWFGYEVKANQELLPAVQLLLQSLCQFLRNTQLQCLHIEWELQGIDKNLHRFSVHSSQAQSNWKTWYQLTCLKVDQLQLKTSIEGLGLLCVELTPGNSQLGDLFAPAQQREPLHSLLDRLQNRLGLQAVEKIACRDEHLPEFAAYSSCDQHSVQTAEPHDRGPRPFWLMPEPQALKLTNRQLYWNGKLTLGAGPERIEDNWWQEAVSRDYYVARDRQGQQYWVFRDRLRERWFIQGIFA